MTPGSALTCDLAGWPAPWSCRPVGWAAGLRAGRGGDGWLCACMSSVANGGVGGCKLVVEGGAHRMRTRGASPSASEVSDMPALGDAPAVAVALPIF